jgi:hypothetical protein
MAAGTSTEADAQGDSSPIAALLFELRHAPGNRRALAAMGLGAQGVASALVLSSLIEARICEGDQRVRAATEEALHTLGWKASVAGWNDLDQLPHADRLIVLERCWSELGLDRSIPQLLERLFDEVGRRFARFRWPAYCRLLELAETDERLAVKMATAILNNDGFGRGLAGMGQHGSKDMARLYNVHQSVRDLITNTAVSEDGGTISGPWFAATMFLATTQNDPAAIAVLLDILTEVANQGRMEADWIPELQLCAKALPGDLGLVRLLLRANLSWDNKVGNTARELLKEQPKVGDGVINAVAEMLKEEDRDIKAACAIFLGNQGARSPEVVAALTDLIDRDRSSRFGTTGVAAILALGCTGEAAAIAPVVRALGRAGDYRLAAYRALDRLSTVSDFELELWLEIEVLQGDPAAKGGGLLAQIHYGRMTPGLLLSALRWGCWDERRPAQSRTGVAGTAGKADGITPTVRRISRELVLPLPLVARAWKAAKEEGGYTKEVARLRRIFGERSRAAKSGTHKLEEVEETSTLPKPTIAQALVPRLQSDIRFVVRMAAMDAMFRTAAGWKVLSHAAAYDRSARVRAAIRAAALARVERRQVSGEELIQGQQDSTWPEPPEDYWDLVEPRHEFQYDQLLDDILRWH